MDAGTAKQMAQDFARAFYSQEDVTHLVQPNTAAFDIVGFGSKSTYFAQGREDVAQCLQRERDSLGACSVFHSRFRTRIEGARFSVKGLIVLRKSDDTAILHKLSLMYREEGERFLLCGIHIARDRRHEFMYLRLCERMLGDHANNDRITPALLQKSSSEDMLNTTRSTFFSYTGATSIRLLDYAESLWQFLGYASADALAADAHSFLTQRFSQNVAESTQRDIRRQLEDHAVYQVEYAVQQADGGMLRVIEYGQRFYREEGEPIYYATLLDLTGLRKMHSSLTYQVSYDNLTGLLNRVAFCQRVRAVLDANPDEHFEIMCLDIERFKLINDLFGEETGDQILRYLADFFREVRLAKSLFARLHSDIFLVFYPATEGNRNRFMKSLRVLASSFTLGYRFLLRFGVYCIRDKRVPVTAMVDRALLALAEAKRQGLMQCYEYDDAIRQGLLNEQSIVNYMNEALQNEEFTLYLQPKYDAVTETVVGAEALVRWKHPVEGMLSPAGFIPVFEHNGFIFQLDQFVWDKTCRLLRRWLDEGRNPLPVSVNVSRVDFYNPQLLNIFDKLMRKYDLPPSLLELEITESAYTDSPQQIIALTKELQARGFKILMDDFGSGYSSLNMLKDLPVDVLKLDLKFLDQEVGANRGESILNAIVRMAKSMQIPVVVEGVETREQADFLRTIGCEYMQGFFFARPIPVEDFEDLLASQPEDATATATWPCLSEFDDLLHPQTNMQRLCNGLLGCVGLYEYRDGHVHLLRANEAGFKLFQETPGLKREYMHDVLPHLAPGDRKILLRAIEDARTSSSSEPPECFLHLAPEGETVLCVKVRVSVMMELGDRLLLLVAWKAIPEA